MYEKESFFIFMLNDSPQSLYQLIRGTTQERK